MDKTVIKCHYRSKGDGRMHDVDRVIKRLEQLVMRMELLRIDAFLCYAEDWKLRLWLDFLSGIVRGVGFSIGFSLLSAMLLFLLKNAALANLPIIGKLMAELVRIVEINLR